MAEAVYRDGAHIVHEVDGKIIWRTDFAPCNLLPATSVIFLPDYEIAFPDLPKSFVYGFDRATVNGFDTGYATTYITMLPQEYVSGPISLGTVPAGVNYLNVSINMYRSKAPSQFLESDIPIQIVENKTQMLDGGSCLVEKFANMRRGFDITLDGTTVNLRLRQSITDAGALFSYLSNNDPGDQPPRAGWTHNGDVRGYPIWLRDKRASTNARSVNRYQSNACATNDVTDYATRIRGAITITPGVVAL